jgi:hypothetical protein
MDCDGKSAFENELRCGRGTKGRMLTVVKGSVPSQRISRCPLSAQTNMFIFIHIHRHASTGTYPLRGSKLTRNAAAIGGIGGSVPVSILRGFRSTMTADAFACYGRNARTPIRHTPSQMLPNANPLGLARQSEGDVRLRRRMRDSDPPRRVKAARNPVPFRVRMMPPCAPHHLGLPWLELYDLAASLDHVEFSSLRPVKDSSCGLVDLYRLSTGHARY